ncbi:Phospholipid-transporting ATPase 2 [Zea mays]|uniref:Phospholipid-transporting ATPase 2 n=1 Tax=Zea mays TaxID=4577 RepID=A0A1D6J582_MAIZE|nr:Phospholipid-transporting ATPase 2 [Zea mays]
MTPGQQIQRYLEAVEMYSQLGLRTLCLGWRDLKENEYKEWSKNFQKASCSLDNREFKIAEVCNSLEQDLQILGVTAIEDRLQDGVPETIKLLRNAGINVWMLTGDKQNTAIQIGLLCNLITSGPNSQLLSISGKTEEDVLRSLERALFIMKNTSETKGLAFVLDGWALELILKHSKESFTRLAMLSKTAICCRMTPLQKAQLVAILKSVGYLTLAIGDGGNDVRMIQEANIGVGISGREGLQAARAADYSIGKFKFLKRLILIHGRYSYNRTAFISQYSFYKSLLMCFIQILLPVMTIIFDKDISETTVMQYPQILLHSQAGRHSSFSSLRYAPTQMRKAFVVTMDTNSFTCPQILLIWGNFVAFYMINLILSTVPSLQLYTITFRLCSQPSYWISMALTVAVGMGPVVAFRYLKNLYQPSAVNILQQVEQRNGSIRTSGNLESAGANLTNLLTGSRKNRDSNYRPLLSESAESVSASGS